MNRKQLSGGYNHVRKPMSIGAFYAYLPKTMYLMKFSAITQNLTLSHFYRVQENRHVNV